MVIILLEFSVVILQARREWDDVFKMLQVKQNDKMKYHYQIFPGKLSL
jgi:hypothetical protein